MAAIDHVYRYARPSALNAAGDGFQLQIAAELTEPSETRFFAGDLLNPLATARGLRAVSDLVGTRFYVPPSMLARILREADPVATVSRDKLHFEGFSACCSTYIRHDLGEAAFAAEHFSPGTTNVDFQADMRAALATVRAATPLRLEVNRESVELHKASESVVERKVPLPTRWIKGFAEVQSHLRGMSARFTLSRVQAQRFLRSLPRGKADHVQWVTPSPQGGRLSGRQSPGSVMIRGTQRLRLLEKLAGDAESLAVWYNEAQGSSAWVLDFGGQSLLLALNSEPWRGFSGDGQLLSSVGASDNSALALLKAQLKWQSVLDAKQLSQDTGLNHEAVENALASLAAQGLLGFDLQAGAYFHRALPFDLSLIERLNPRLKSAEELYRKGAVKVRVDGSSVSAEVQSDGVTHRVILGESCSTCTCPWYAKHQGARGPCKHVLATEMALEET